VAANEQTIATPDATPANDKSNDAQDLDQPLVKPSSKKKAVRNIPTRKGAVAAAKENIVKTRVPVAVDHSTEKAVMGKDDNGNENVTTKEETKSKPVGETQTKEKKKKLGEVIKGIFSKKEKKQAEKTETVLEDPKPAENRQSQHREDDAGGNVPSTKENIDISDQVDLTSNAPDNWMMGVKGLKITLRNRSTLAIQSAAVDVFYYDENNRILEKKLLSFSNVSAKGKLTLGAPDNQWADHVDFKLGAVVLKDDRYAKN